MGKNAPNLQKAARLFPYCKGESLADGHRFLKAGNVNFS